MQLPLWQDGWLILPEGKIALDYCWMEDMAEIFEVPPVYYPLDDGVMQFVIDQDDCEISYFIGPFSEALLELHIELLEELEFDFFLKEFFNGKPENYEYLEHQGQTFVVFSKNFMIRLSEKTNKVACLVFMSSDFIEACQSDLAENIRLRASGQTFTN